MGITKQTYAVDVNCLAKERCILEHTWVTCFKMKAVLVYVLTDVRNRFFFWNFSLLVSRINMYLLTNATLVCSPPYASQGTKIRPELRPLFNHPLSLLRNVIPVVRVEITYVEG